jgi:hypothetical protein
MRNFEDIVIDILMEAAPKGSIRARLKYAIENRYPVSFYYNGPKDEVLPGRRIKAEMVAMGLTKKGNLVVRAWVQPPSTSKKGFEEHGWRLFNLKRMSGVQIYENETFDTERPNYNPEGDKSLTTIDAKSVWGTTTPTPTKVEPTSVQPTPTKVEPTPQVEPKTTELPQPKPEEKPAPTPTPEIKREVEVFNDLKTKVTDVEGKKQITPDDFKDSIDILYNKKLEDWKNTQRDAGGNTNAGEGTRRRLEKDAESDLFNLMKNDNIMVTQNQLQESIKRMKTLIFF